MTDGVVVTYDPKRGFGFIRVKGLREDVFVHASELTGGAPLAAGQRVRFEIADDPRGPRAVGVLPGPRGLPPWLASVVGLVVVLGLLAWGFVKLGLGPAGAIFVALNVVTWLVYGWDKRLAGSNARRVPEAALLGLALLGGSPGAAFGMWAFRHKTRKKPFLVAFGAVILCQAVLIYGWWINA